MRGFDLTVSLPRGFSQPEGDQSPCKSIYDIPMGKASRTKQDGDRRARIAAQREAQRRAEQRKRIYLAGGAVLVVAIIVVALVLVKLNSSKTPAAASSGPTGTALAAVTNQVTGVPTSVTDKVADGGVNKSVFVPGHTSSQISALANQNYFATVDSSTPLTSGGKPEVLYLGGEYCPFCAAQRWAMINALSRFGAFSGLTTTHSSSTDSYPNTPTYTFYKSTYTSDYITFTPVEEYTDTPNGSGGYTTLQTPTSAQQAIGQQYDTGGAIPFIDLGNKYVQVGNLAPLSPSLLAGKSWSQVASAMNDPSSAIGKAEIGNANYMTAAICQLTNNKPTTACTPTIQKLESNFAS